MADWPELYILRHGQTEWNATGRIQGSLDSKLTGLGMRQARAQNAILTRRDLRGFAAWCSPQGRARHTAEIALAGLCDKIRVDARLGEIALGAWEGRLRAEVAPELEADEWAETGLWLFDRAPEGEGFAALHARCLSFLRDLDGPAILVTHGITSRMLRLIHLGLELPELADLPGGQGVVYHVAKGSHRLLS